MISVVVCAHNPRPEHFAQCVAALRRQTVRHDRWELIIVDNASAPARAPRADLSWHPRMRIIQEPVLGLTPARLTGIAAARGDLLVFVDADNLPDPDFLEAALHVADARPFLGSWSGQCRPQFEQPPPEWTRRYWGNLSIREFDSERWSNQPRLPETMPLGAGLCVRRDVADRYVALHQSGLRAFQFDRAGDSLMSGGDNDLAACACDLRLGMGLMPSLKLTHLIPPDRLTESYLARLTYGIYYSAAVLDAARGMVVQPRGLAGSIADFGRVLMTRPPHRSIQAAAHAGRRDAARQLASHGPVAAPPGAFAQVPRA